MREALAPILFHDDRGTARESAVAGAEPSPRARRKAASGRTEDGFPVLGF